MEVNDRLSERSMVEVLPQQPSIPFNNNHKSFKNQFHFCNALVHGRSVYLDPTDDGLAANEQPTQKARSTHENTKYYTKMYHLIV